MAKILPMINSEPINLDIGNKNQYLLNFFQSVIICWWHETWGPIKHILSFRLTLHFYSPRVNIQDSSNSGATGWSRGKLFSEDWWLIICFLTKTTSICFLQFWRLGSPRLRCSCGGSSCFKRWPCEDTLSSHIADDLTSLTLSPEL